jgi:hypothetical protein
MKKATLLGLLALFAIGCSGGSSDSEKPAFQGKPNIQDAPPGSTAPGDSRPSQSDESRDGG